MAEQAGMTDQFGDKRDGAESADPYVVVARRYRPQSFEQLVGQNQVSRALGNAIETHRVGHAYLFTGARGVGKTSTARIFSKCLNCQTGPTTQPCDRCDACQAISVGEDVDVLEIDGASNRGIDEIRQLRSFASVRPSRSQHKIYIIDEVHMLTKEAFNALLKTLEEPPPHVKFIFCTTNPEKIPITVLSRCQRFDFAPVVADEIKDRLKFIVDAEGAEAEDDALTLLARRAGGSMRDSQSLLEQLLAFASGKITVQSVHQMLGTAPGGRVETLVQAIANSDAGAALEEIHNSIREGADVGQVLEQLSGYVRDLMVLSVGGSPETLLQLGPGEVAQGLVLAQHMGTARLLATLQVFDWALARMRQSTQIRCLLEIAVVQACGLAALSSLAAAIDTVGRLTAGAGSGPTAPPSRLSLGPAAGADTQEKKNEPIVSAAAADPTAARATEPAPSATTIHSTAPKIAAELVSTSAPAPAPAPAAATLPRTAASVEAVVGSERCEELDSVAGSQRGLATTDAASPLQQYRAAFQSIDGMIRDLATSCVAVEPVTANHWRVLMENEYLAELCQRQDRRQQIEGAVEAALGRRVRIDFGFRAEAQPHGATAGPTISKTQALRDLQELPFVIKLNEIYSAEWVELLPARQRKNSAG